MSLTAQPRSVRWGEDPASTETGPGLAQAQGLPTSPMRSDRLAPVREHLECLALRVCCIDKSCYVIVQLL